MFKTLISKVFLIFYFLFFFPFSVFSNPSSPLKNNVAVTAHSLATQAGIQMYQKGGNAVDAAVAAAFALGVVEPHNSGIGGGGFMMIYLSSEKKTVILDYREVAPFLVHPNTYADQSSTVGYSAIAVPGEVLGLTEALKKYGSLTLKEVMKPAMAYAEEGFHISPLLEKRIQSRQECLRRFDSTRKIYFQNEIPLKAQETLIQKDLAKTLRLISKKGPEVFYQGRIAQKIDHEMKKNQGLIRLKDLKDYQVKERTPLFTNYRGYELVLMPLPSSGGILLTKMFQEMEKKTLASGGSWKEAELLMRTMKSAFKERMGLGDEGGNTTHASFVDQEGNAVSMTNSLNLPFGSCVTIAGTGILMNDQMDDFATTPTPNAFGLVQGAVNQVAAGKRPLSSMSPTIVFKEGQPVYVLGSPGGPTIISNVFQVLVNLIDHHLSLEEAIAKPKLHHQYQPDVIRYEKNYPSLILQKFEKKGFHLESSESWGNVQAIEINWNTHFAHGVSDPRGEGVAKE